MSKRNPKYENSFWQHFVQWVQGTHDPVEGKLETKVRDKEFFGDEKIHYINLHIQNVAEYDESRFEEGMAKRVNAYTKFSRVMSVILAIFMIGILFWTVRYLPQFGDPNAPENNEVATRYIESGLEETGAVNIVAGMILDYRAFDTFGESCVLFVASCCVLILLRVDKDEDPHSRALEDMYD